MKFSKKNLIIIGFAMVAVVIIGLVVYPRIMFKIGKEKEKSGELNAIFYYQQAAKFYYSEAYGPLGDSYNQLNKTELGFKYYRRAVEAGHHEYIRNLASYYHNAKMFGHALDWYKKALEQGDKLVLNDLGEIYYNNLNQRETAKEYFLRSVIEAENCSAMENLGDIAKDEKKYNEALKWYRTAEKTAKSDCIQRDLQEKIENVYKEMGQLPEYFLEYNLHIAGKGDIKAMLQLAEYYHQQKQLEKVIEWYRKAAELKNSMAYSLLVEAYLEQKELNNALKWVKIAETCGDKSCYLPIAVYYAKQNDISNAIKWYQKVINANPKNVLARLELAHIYCSQHEFSKACNLYRQLAEQKYSFAMCELGRIAEEQNRLANAFEWYQRADALNSHQAQFRLGLLYKKQNKLKKAVEYLQRAADSNDAIVLLELVKIFNAKRNTSGGQFYIKKLVQRRSVEVLVMLGDFYVEKQQYRNARNCYSKAYEFKKQQKIVKKKTEKSVDNSPSDKCEISLAEIKKLIDEMDKALAEKPQDIHFVAKN